MDERILVVPRTELFAKEALQGFCALNDRDYLATILNSYQYRVRGEVESDPSFKQIIPYVMIREMGDPGAAPRYFVFQRTKKAGENRLHDLFSIGIGGHISQEDEGVIEVPLGLETGQLEQQLGKDSRTFLKGPLFAGFLRELGEEVSLPERTEVSLAGFLNDDSNEVGRVHLGLVFEIDAWGPVKRSAEVQELLGQTRPLDEIETLVEKMETWSQILVTQHLLVKHA
ncbi:MAG: hypothetical protein JW937_00180 [Candidatus Omnitrophica bacterium]|nr:hypothetical protein [Candidatus Omnitrophota bacterium]